MAEKTINLKFNIGDKAYIIRTTTGLNNLHVTCPVCNGTGKFTSPVTGATHDCPGVNGYICKDGIVHVEWNNYYYVDEGIVSSIYIGNDSIHYSLSMPEFDFDTYTENDMYTTRQEAQLECDRRNSKNEGVVKNG